MKSGTIYDVVRKLVGYINPVGETTEDNERFENLRKMTQIVEWLTTDISRIRSNMNCHEYSMKHAGEYADTFLNELAEEIKE